MKYNEGSNNNIFDKSVIHIMKLMLLILNIFMIYNHYICEEERPIPTFSFSSVFQFWFGLVCCCRLKITIIFNFKPIKQSVLAV